MRNCIKKRIFIVGCPRSGTTLLQSLLLKHKDITSFPESHFFSRTFLGGQSSKYPTLNANYVYNKWVKEIKYNKIFLKYHISFSRDSMVKFFIKELDRWTLYTNKSIWIEKTPAHLYTIQIIESFLPNAVFIHIIRDGKDVVASLYEASNKYKKEWKTSYSIMDAVERYNKDIKISQTYKGKKNHIFIRYEDLLENKNNINTIFEILKLDIRDLTKNKDTYSSIVSRNEPWKELNKTNYIIDTRNKKFREIFTISEQEYIINRIEKSDDLLFV